jgi:hypothetical protein
MEPQQRDTRPGDGRRHRLLERWRRLTRRRRAVAQVSLWFAGTYAVTRGIRYLQLNDRFPWGDGLQVKGEQIHHYVWGLLLLGLQSMIETAFDVPLHDVRRAALFGAGLALALDEADILLNASDWYWVQDGRPWLDAAVLSSMVTLIGMASAPIVVSPARTDVLTPHHH